MTFSRILLLGDSIIDNGAYVGEDEPDVAEQLRQLMPDLAIEKRAYDGSVTNDVTAAQVQDIRTDDLVVISSGGNDALSHASLLETETSVPSLFAQLWLARENFRADYIVLLSR